MALPPRGDPDRPLRVAARLMMRVGIFGLVVGLPLGVGLGLLVLFEISNPPRPDPGAIGAGLIFASALAVALFALFLLALPGALFVVAATALKRYKLWGALLGLIVAGLLLLTYAAFTVATLPWVIESGGKAFLVSIIGLLLCLRFGGIVYHLLAAVRVIRTRQLDSSAGRAFPVGELPEPPKAACD